MIYNIQDCNNPFYILCIPSFYKSKVVIWVETKYFWFVGGQALAAGRLGMRGPVAVTRRQEIHGPVTHMQNYQKSDQRMAFLCFSMLMTNEPTGCQEQATTEWLKRMKINRLVSTSFKQSFSFTVQECVYAESWYNFEQEKLDLPSDKGDNCDKGDN